MSIQSALYSLFIRRFTFTHYRQLVRWLPEGAELLDVGVGNGLVFDGLAGEIRKKRIRILGLDIHEAYLERCRARVRANGLDDLVTCQRRDVLEYLSDSAHVPRYIYFSASFMLLADQQRVLELARRRMPDDGRLLFAQTLLPERNRFAEWLKPRLKYVTTIDFGRVQYREPFVEQVTLAGFDLEHEKRFSRVTGNPYLFFHVFQPHVDAPEPALAR